MGFGNRGGSGSFVELVMGKGEWWVLGFSDGGGWGWRFQYEFCRGMGGRG